MQPLISYCLFEHARSYKIVVNNKLDPTVLHFCSETHYRPHSLGVKGEKRLPIFFRSGHKKSLQLIWGIKN